MQVHEPAGIDVARQWAGAPELRVVQPCPSSQPPGFRMHQPRVGDGFTLFHRHRRPAAISGSLELWRPSPPYCAVHRSASRAGSRQPGGAGDPAARAVPAWRPEQALGDQRHHVIQPHVDAFAPLDHQFLFAINRQPCIDRADRVRLVASVTAPSGRSDASNGSTTGTASSIRAAAFRSSARSWRWTGQPLTGTGLRAQQDRHHAARLSSRPMYAFHASSSACWAFSYSARRDSHCALYLVLCVRVQLRMLVVHPAVSRLQPIRELPAFRVHLHDHVPPGTSGQLPAGPGWLRCSRSALTVWRRRSWLGDRFLFIMYTSILILDFYPVTFIPSIPVSVSPNQVMSNVRSLVETRVSTVFADLNQRGYGSFGRMRLVLCRNVEGFAGWYRVPSTFRIFVRNRPAVFWGLFVDSMGFENFGLKSKVCFDKFRHFDTTPASTRPFSVPERRAERAQRYRSDASMKIAGCLSWRETRWRTPRAVHFAANVTIEIALEMGWRCCSTAMIRSSILRSLLTPQVGASSARSSTSIDHDDRCLEVTSLDRFCTIKHREHERPFSVRCRVACCHAATSLPNSVGSARTSHPSTAMHPGPS